MCPHMKIYDISRPSFISTHFYAFIIICSHSVSTHLWKNGILTLDCLFSKSHFIEIIKQTVPCWAWYSARRRREGAEAHLRLIGLRTHKQNAYREEQTPKTTHWSVSFTVRYQTKNETVIIRQESLTQNQHCIGILSFLIWKSLLGVTSWWVGE